MAKCESCNKNISLWNTYFDNETEYCKGCWQKKKDKIKQVEVKQEDNDNSNKINKDKELVRGIYEKRKNEQDLNLKERLRVAGIPFWLFILTIGLVIKLCVDFRVLNFESYQFNIENDYGLGKQYTKPNPH